MPTHLRAPASEHVGDLTMIGPRSYLFRLSAALVLFSVGCEDDVPDALPDGGMVTADAGPDAIPNAYSADGVQHGGSPSKVVKNVLIDKYTQLSAGASGKLTQTNFT
ncbi:MAG: hypothetical protein KA712_07880 [Myxococcales bacterium]|nr:hypothetical protein [Myxococcales bacterium]